MFSIICFSTKRFFNNWDLLLSVFFLDKPLTLFSDFFVLFSAYFCRTNIEDLEAGNIEHTDEVISCEVLSIEGLVASSDEPSEETSVQSFRKSAEGPVNLQTYKKFQNSVVFVFF